MIKCQFLNVSFTKRKKRHFRVYKSKPQYKIIYVCNSGQSAEWSSRSDHLFFEQRLFIGLNFFCRTVLTFPPAFWNFPSFCSFSTSSLNCFSSAVKRTCGVSKRTYGEVCAKVQYSWLWGVFGYMTLLEHHPIFFLFCSVAKTFKKVWVTPPDQVRFLCRVHLEFAVGYQQTIIEPKCPYWV